MAFIAFHSPVDAGEAAFASWEAAFRMLLSGVCLAWEVRFARPTDWRFIRPEGFLLPSPHRPSPASGTSVSEVGSMTPRPRGSCFSIRLGARPCCHEVASAPEGDTTEAFSTSSRAAIWSSSASSTSSQVVGPSYASS